MSIDIFVDGEPVPQPKKLPTGKMGILRERDPAKYKNGSPRKTAKAWRDEIYYTLVNKLPEDFSHYPNGVPLTMVLNFYRTQPPSNKDRVPCRRPDQSNYAYLVENLLEGREDKGYLGGKVYDNDSQISVSVVTVDWADKKHPAGVNIMVFRRGEFQIVIPYEKEQG